MPLVLLAVTATATPVLGPERVLVEDPRGFDIATNGDVHLLAWRDASSVIHAQVLRATDAEPVGPAFVVAGPSASEPAVASNGTDFLIAWVEGDAQGEVRASRVSSAGAVLDPGGILVDDNAGSDGGTLVFVRHYWPDATWAGGQWFVGWYSPVGYGVSSIARIDATGVVLGTIDLRSVGEVTLASDGTNAIVAYHTEEGGSTRILGTDGSSAGAGDGIAYCHGRVAGIASAGGGYAGVCTGGDDWAAEYGSWITLFSGAGARIRRQRFTISQREPAALTTMNGRYLIAWDEGVEIRVLQLSPSLEPVGSAVGKSVLRHEQLAGIIAGREDVLVLVKRGTSIVGRFVSL